MKRLDHARICIALVPGVAAAACAPKPAADVHRPVAEEAIDLQGSSSDPPMASAPSAPAAANAPKKSAFADLGLATTDDPAATMSQAPVVPYVWGQSNDPPINLTLDGFGSAKLGASTRSFHGLKFAEKDPHGGGEFYHPSSLVYEGIPLSHLSYEFKNDRLFDVDFDVKRYEDGPELLAHLEKHYGKGKRSKLPAEAGFSVEWWSHKATMRFNMFETSKKCGGIVWADQH
ncbi:MAG: hypothetical protein ACRELY_13065 [Polyangiaceae bacterium]